MTNSNEVVNIVGAHFREKSDAVVTGIRFVNSKVTYLSSGFLKKFINCENLEMNSIGLEVIDKIAFAEGSKLKYFSAQFNRLKALEAGIFQGAANLESILLSFNDIKNSQTFRGLQKLRELHMWGNLIQELSNETFSWLVNLDTINLSGNQLKSISGDLLKNNVKLTSLSLASNAIIAIESNFFDSRRNLMSIFLVGNVCINFDFIFIYNGNLAPVVPYFKDCFANFSN